MTAQRVHIDAARCQGHGRCYAVAPDLFEPDEMGMSRLRQVEAFDSTLEAAARLAAANCPERAVIIDEEE